MSYKKIARMVVGKSLPVAGRNEHGETVVVEGGQSASGRFFRITTAQSNNWCRINTYFENGNSDETYCR